MSFIKSIFRMANVERFAGLSLASEYTIGEHSYRVATLAMAICDQYNKDNPKKKINTEEVMRKALLHDMEEIVSGDIPSPFKAYGNLREELRKASEKTMKEEILPGSPDPEHYLKLWKEDKDGETGEVITVADKLEGLLVSFYEYKRGNKFIEPSLENHISWFVSSGKDLIKKYSYAETQFKEVSKYFKTKSDHKKNYENNLVKIINKK